MSNICSKCGKPFKGRWYPNYTCQTCYNYFLKGGTVHPLPKPGVIAHDEKGFVICHMCGRSYIRLGSHIKEFHKMTIAEYKEMFGLCNNARTTEVKYSKHMSDLAYRNDMPNMLLERGKDTVLKPGNKLRLGKKSRMQECIDRAKRTKKYYDKNRKNTGK